MELEKDYSWKKIDEDTDYLEIHGGKIVRTITDSGVSQVFVPVRGDVPDKLADLTENF